MSQPSDIERFIHGLLESEFLNGPRPPRAGPAPPVVTVCRSYGAGGREIAGRLAAQLQVPLYDRNLIDAVAQAAKVEPHRMAELDENLQPRPDAWMYNLLSGQNAFLAAYRYHLVNAVLAVAESGGVILGRGAHLILANRPAYRVRVVGSERVCAGRVAEREGLTFEAAAGKVRQVNEQRRHYLDNLFRRRPEEGNHFDLVLNTDRFGNGWDGAAHVILGAMMEAGAPALAAH